MRDGSDGGMVLVVFGNIVVYSLGGVFCEIRGMVVGCLVSVGMALGRPGNNPGGLSAHPGDEHSGEFEARHSGEFEGQPFGVAIRRRR